MWHHYEMPKKINYTLSTEELLTIEQAIKSHTDLRVRQRAQIIRLLHKGYSPTEIGELLSINMVSVYGWHKRWRTEGIAGLEERPRSGRPKVGDETYRQKLEEVIATDPSELGYGFTVWDSARLMAHLEKETGIRMCERTFRNILAEQEYVYRRPKHDLSGLQDKDIKEEAKITLEMLKKRPKREKSNFSLWTKQR